MNGCNSAALFLVSYVNLNLLTSITMVVIWITEKGTSITDHKRTVIPQKLVVLLVLNLPTSPSRTEDGVVVT